MIKEKSLVIYKNQPAIVTSNIVNGKFSIKYISSPETQTKSAVYSTQNVREKDVLFLFDQIESLEKVISFSKENACKEENIYNLNQSEEIFLQIKDAWELLVSDENTKDSLIEFNELVSLFTVLTSQNAWCIYVSIRSTLFFMQDYKSSLEGKICFSVRTKAQIDEIIKKENEKGKELEERQNFIQRLKQHKLLPDDTKYMVDVEALALGKTDRSKTLSEAKIKETPERAHKLLLDLGIWSITRNPYPSRWGCSMQSSDVSLESPPEEERFCVKDPFRVIH